MFIFSTQELYFMALYFMAIIVKIQKLWIIHSTFTYAHLLVPYLGL